MLFQGYEVTDPEVLAQLGVPPGEIVGRLPARFILEAAEEASRSRMTMLTDAEFNELFTTFERTAFRLETLQIYRVPGLDEQFETFLRGDPLPPRNPETSPWLRQIAANASAGKRTYRVHVVDRPLSDYLRYELDSYHANVAAGEEVSIVDRTTTPTLRRCARTTGCSTSVT